MSHGKDVRALGSNSAGDIILNITADKKLLEKILQGIEKDGSKAGKSLEKGFLPSLKKIGTAVAGAFAVGKIISFGKSCIDLGSDLAEVQNVVDVTFGSMSAQIDEYARNAMKVSGLSETMAKQFTGNYGAMAKAFGFSTKEAYDMSTALTSLAGDVASFYNLDQEEAYTKLKSVFTGETESLKELGVVMTQTALDSFALANGFGKTTSTMTEAEKVSLRYAFVQNRLSAAAGDFERTSGGWANQMRVLNLQFESFMATIGQGLINALTPALQMLNRLMERLQVVAQAFSDLTERIFGFSESSSGGTGAAAADMAAVAESASEAQESLEKSSKYLAGFDAMTKVSSASSGSTSTETGTSGNTSASTAIVNSAASVKQVSLFEKALDSLLGKFNQVGSWVKSKFEKPIRDAIGKISKPLGDLKTTFGRVFGDIQGLGSSFVSWLSTGFAGNIASIIALISSNIAGILGLTNTAISGIWDNLLQPLLSRLSGEWLPKLSEIFDEVLGLFAHVSDEIWNGLNTLWNECINPILSLISNVVIGVIDGIFAAWEQYGQPLMDSLHNLIKETGATIQTFWETILKPVFDNLIERIQELWDNHLQPLWKKLCGAFLQITTALANAWNFFMVVLQGFMEEWGPGITSVINFVVDTIGEGLGIMIDALGGLLDFVVNIFTGNWSEAWEQVKSIFGSLGDFFNGVWLSIKDIFSGIPDWFRNKFSAAWQAVKDVFSKGGEVFAGIKDGILSELKSIINGLISGINSVISVPFNGINDALNAIKSINILGAKPFSGLPNIAVPQIPMLAQGGYVKANTPQLAMIGDNRHQGEVVSPESKLLDMAYQAANMAAGGNTSLLLRIITLLEQLVSLVQDGADIVLMVDGEELARATANGSIAIKRRYATTEVKFV